MRNMQRNDNITMYDVDEFEIIETEKSKTSGERLTKFNCIVCQASLSESELSAIRYANAPPKHYKCNF
jgi:hypothetical protein